MSRCICSITSYFFFHWIIQMTSFHFENTAIIYNKDSLWYPWDCHNVSAYLFILGKLQSCDLHMNNVSLFQITYVAKLMPVMEHMSAQDLSPFNRGKQGSSKTNSSTKEVPPEINLSIALSFLWIISKFCVNILKCHHECSSMSVYNNPYEFLTWFRHINLLTL